MGASTPKALIGVIDDDEMVRDSLKVLLETREYAVADFSSGSEFLNRPSHDDMACLVLDVHMPEMTGLDLLQRLRHGGDKVPVVMITGRSDPQIKAQAKSLGAVATLDKPAFTALFQAIEQALNS
jgi:two-component system response regulator FixJ